MTKRIRIDWCCCAKWLTFGCRQLKQTAIITCIVLTSVFTACGPATTPVEDSLESQILLLGNGVEPVDLDPQITTGVSEINIHMALFEGLVRPDPATAVPVAGVARRWSSSSDGLVWRFELRDDARWSNGDPVTAGDFLFAWERILSPELGAPNAMLLYIVRGARAFNAGEISDFSSTGFRRIDRSTVEIELSAPAPYFLSLLMHPAWFPLHPETVKQHNGERRRGSGWTQPENHVGNGAFKLVHWRVNDYVEVRANAYYHSEHDIHLAGIRFFPIESRHAEQRAFEAGHLHKTYGLPPGLAPRLRDANDPHLRIEPALGVDYYLFNTERPPLDDARVRRALSTAVERDALTKYVLSAGQMPAHRFTPPGLDGYEPAARIESAATVAQEFLAEAGYPGGRGFPTLRLLYNTSEQNRQVAEAVQHMWKKNLGIEVELFNQETRAYFDTRARGDFDIARASWVADYPDPNSFLELWTSWSANNYSGWKHADFDAHIRAALTIDEAERASHFEAAEHILLRDSPIAPLFFHVNGYLIHSAVLGWHPSPFGWRTYHGIRIGTREH